MRTSLRRFFAKLLNVVTPGRVEDDLAREIASHLSLIEDEHRRRGMPAACPASMPIKCFHAD